MTSLPDRQIRWYFVSNCFNYEKCISISSAHPLCCRLLTYVQYVGETAPRVRTLVNALIRRYEVDGALVIDQIFRFGTTRFDENP